MAQTETQTDGHGDYMSNSAQWGRVGEKRITPFLNESYALVWRKQLKAFFNIDQTFPLHWTISWRKSLLRVITITGEFTKNSKSKLFSNWLWPLPLTHGNVNFKKSPFDFLSICQKIDLILIWIFGSTPPPLWDKVYILDFFICKMLHKEICVRASLFSICKCSK